MPFEIFLIVLLSALLHAFWNLLSKKSSPSAAFFMLMSVSNTVLWSWTVFFVDVNWSAVGATFFIALLASLAAEDLYFIGIANAYRKVDISTGYPLIRALPVLMIALIQFVFPPHKFPGLSGLTGLALVSCGCLFMPLKRFRDFRLSDYRGPAAGFILLAAAGTTGYTLLDAFALKKLELGSSGAVTSCFYLFILEAGIAFTLGCYTLRSRIERAELKRILRTAPLFPVAAGLASSIAYAMILYCMPRVTQLSFLQAFRQMSLPFGVLLGVLILKEKAGVARWTGVAFILTGLVLIALR